MATTFTSSLITNIGGVNNWVDGTEAHTSFDVTGSAVYTGTNLSVGDTFTVILAFGGSLKMTVTGHVTSVDTTLKTIQWTAPCTNLDALFNSADGTKRMTASLSVDGTTGFVTSPQQTFSYLSCFTRGTMLTTPDGERAVETLQEGDLLLTATGAARPVKWIGHRVVSAGRHIFAGRISPVRICQDAFADGLPTRDVLLSPDHAILADGKLISAQQLVNGATILLEPHQPEVEYFHVELDTHDVLLASGLPVESYLDTGNRGFFGNADVPVALHPDLAAGSDQSVRDALSCAPFASDEQSVQPVWQRLAERARAMGRQIAAPSSVVDDPDLRLDVAGVRVDAVSRSGSRFLFPLPDGSLLVRLLSRSGSPVDTRPWADDTRQLGVRIARLRFRQGTSVEDIALDGPTLHGGWWDIERDGADLRRWTDGDAMLTLPRSARMGMLEVELSDVLPYVVQDTGRRAA